MSQQINLFNPQLLQQRLPFSANTLLQLVVIVSLAAAAAVVYMRQQTQALQASASIVSQQLLTAQNQVAGLRGEEVAPVKSAGLEEQIAKLELQLQQRQKVAEILKSSDFGNTAGYSAYLTAFARQAPSGLWLTGFYIGGAGHEMSLQGGVVKPELLPQYVNQLRQETVMQGKSFSSIQMQLPAPVINADADKASKNKVMPNFLEFSLRSADASEKKEGARE